MAECGVPQLLGSKVIKPPDLVLVAGAEGIMGGSLFYELLRSEFNIRCLVRMEDDDKIDRKPGVEFFYCDPWKGDIPESAFDGVKYVVNAVSPLNTGSVPSDDLEAFERLSNILITRCASKHLGRYVGISSVNLSDSEESRWAHANMHTELSAINSGAPFTLLRSGILLDGKNDGVLRRIGSTGLGSFLSRKGTERLYVTPMKLLSETIARVLKTDQSTSKTYEVIMGSQMSRKEIGRTAGQPRPGTAYNHWETDVQIELSAGRYGGNTAQVSELEIKLPETAGIIRNPGAVQP
jgi:uncharacterized protein YbjT (DUF2867 family)